VVEVEVEVEGVLEMLEMLEMRGRQQTPYHRIAFQW
jgi:hypothetical protein